MDAQVQQEPDAGFWSEGAMPLERWARFRSDSVDAVHEHMSSMFGAHKLSTLGGTPPMAFQHNQARLQSITFNFTDYGNPYGQVGISIPPADEFFFVQLPLSGRARILVQGKSFELFPGQLCVLGGHLPATQILDSGYRHFTVKIPTSDLKAILAEEVRRAPNSLEFVPVPIKIAGEAGAFAHLVRTICDDIENGVTTYTHPRVYGAVEDVLKRLLLAAAPHNYSDTFNMAARSPVPYYLRRVEVFICAHATEPISLTDLIRASGVSGRSLHAGFRRFRSETPMGYLKKHRLDLAHRKLKTAIEHGQSVTDVAFACGFTHLSKFARYYQERFGERPSDTLRQLARGRTHVGEAVVP